MLLEIKKLSNEHFMQLVSLNFDMYKSFDASINEVGATATLLHDINDFTDYTAFGLFNKDKLVGFVSGYCFTKKRFHFSSLYVKIKNNKNLIKLINHALKYVEEQGYTSWSADTSNSNMASILSKLGARVKYSHYVKEF